MISTRRNYVQKINSWCTETKAGVVTPSLDSFFIFLACMSSILFYFQIRHVTRYAERALCFVIHHKLPYSQFLIRTNFNLRSTTVAKKAENITPACTVHQNNNHLTFIGILTLHIIHSARISCDKLLVLFRLLNVSCSRIEHTPPSWEPKPCHFSLREWLSMPSPRMRSTVQ